MNELRRLKKYPNRRLYDFERHCYVCLDDVRKLIASNQDIQVIENATSNDITRETLMQVVMLLEDGDRPLFSHSFLAQLIQCHALGTSGDLARYLDECMKEFVANGGAIEEPSVRAAEAPATARNPS
jgi:polyhydroxyalkanoate synthesis repressor PhaR